MRIGGEDARDRLKRKQIRYGRGPIPACRAPWWRGRPGRARPFDSMTRRKLETISVEADRVAASSCLLMASSIGPTPSIATRSLPFSAIVSRSTAAVRKSSSRPSSGNSGAPRSRSAALARSIAASPRATPRTKPLDRAGEIGFAPEGLHLRPKPGQLPPAPAPESRSGGRARLRNRPAAKRFGPKPAARRAAGFRPRPASPPARPRCDQRQHGQRALPGLQAAHSSPL